MKCYIGLNKKKSGQVIITFLNFQVSWEILVKVLMLRNNELEASPRPPHLIGLNRFMLRSDIISFVIQTGLQGERPIISP